METKTLVKIFDSLKYLAQYGEKDGDGLRVLIIGYDNNIGGIRSEIDGTRLLIPLPEAVIVEESRNEVTLCFASDGDLVTFSRETFEYLNCYTLTEEELSTLRVLTLIADGLKSNQMRLVMNGESDICTEHFEAKIQRIWDILSKFGEEVKVNINKDNDIIDGIAWQISPKPGKAIVGRILINTKGEELESFDLVDIVDLDKKPIFDTFWIKMTKNHTTKGTEMCSIEKLDEILNELEAHLKNPNASD